MLNGSFGNIETTLFQENRLLRVVSLFYFGRLVIDPQYFLSIIFHRVDFFNWPLHITPGPLQSVHQGAMIA